GPWLIAAQALPSTAGQPSAVTFTKDVAPIVFQHCALCHRPGELAPFNLLTYDDVKQHARQIAIVTKSGFMPPWKPDRGDFPFANERRLSSAEIQIFQQWEEAGS